jgi:hypothetical protein
MTSKLRRGLGIITPPAVIGVFQLSDVQGRSMRWDREDELDLADVGGASGYRPRLGF